MGRIWSSATSACRAVPAVAASTTGLPISTYSSALKLAWLLDADPSRRAAAERGDLLSGTPDTWLLWNLTGGPDGGVHATDPSNAGRTMLYDIGAREWSVSTCRPCRSTTDDLW